MATLPLTLHAIVAVAISVADDEGLDAVSMRRVAGPLNVSAMSLYRHVEDRDALLVQMATTATQSFPLLPDAETEWRPLLTHMAHADWQAFERHPWLLRIILTPQRLLNLASDSQLETLLGSLHRAGLPLDACFDALIGVSGLAIGMAAIAAVTNEQAANAQTANAQAANAQPAPDPTSARAAGSTAAADTTAPAHPLAAAFAARGISHAVTAESFDFALERLLDGIQTQLHPTHTH